MSDIHDKDISEIYEKHVTPGPDSFITRFDAELEMFLRDIFENPFSIEHKELPFFLENARKEGLIDPSIKNLNIIDKCLDFKDSTITKFQSNGIKKQLQGILNVKIQQFLAEALLYDARILSTLETNERKSLTKPEIKDNGDIAFWNPAGTDYLITEEYLEKISSFAEGKIYTEEDYNTKKETPVIGPFGIEIKENFGLEEKERIKYGFGVKYKIEDGRKVFKEGTSLRINFCRRLGVIIYDLIMAKIGKKIIEKLSEEERDNINKLFSEFIDFRSEKIAFQIKKFLDAEKKKDIKIVLLQEVGKAIFKELPKSATTTKSQVKKIETRNAGSMILSNQKLEAGNDNSNKSYELEHSTLKLIGDSVLELFSFHGDTKGLKTSEVIEKILKENKDKPLIIGLDGNLKKPKLLFDFMVMCYKNGAKIAGFDLESFNFKTNNEYKKGTDFDKFYNKLQKFATNGGIRSGCQSQWGKMHDPTQDYIDFIVYRAGKGPENNLEQVLIKDTKPIKIKDDIGEVTLVNAGIVDYDVYKIGTNDGWGAKVLSQTNPSDHLPRCSTFKLGEQILSVLSWNVAGPNFNWAEYYGSDNKLTILEEINNINKKNTDAYSQKATRKRTEDLLQAKQELTESGTQVPLRFRTNVYLDAAAKAPNGGAPRRRNRKSRKNKAKKSRKARNNADNSDRKSRRGRGRRTRHN